MSMRTESLQVHGATPPPVEFSGRKIQAIVVDDVPSMLETICAVLELEDLVEVIGRAHNGAEAVNLAAHLKPDLVLMDVCMPEMDGMEAASILAREFPRIRVVLMSGDQTPAIREQARRCADGFIFKLNFPEEFVPVLWQLFPRQRQMNYRVTGRGTR